MIQEDNIIGTIYYECVREKERLVQEYKFKYEAIKMLYDELLQLILHKDQTKEKKSSRAASHREAKSYSPVYSFLEEELRVLGVAKDHILRIKYGIMERLEDKFNIKHMMSNITNTWSNLHVPSATALKGKEKEEKGKQTLYKVSSSHGWNDNRDWPEGNEQKGKVQASASHDLRKSNPTNKGNSVSPLTKYIHMLSDEKRASKTSCNQVPVGFLLSDKSRMARNDQKESNTNRYCSHTILITPRDNQLKDGRKQVVTPSTAKYSLRSLKNKKSVSRNGFSGQNNGSQSKYENNNIQDRVDNDQNDYNGSFGQVHYTNGSTIL